MFVCAHRGASPRNSRLPALTADRYAPRGDGGGGIFLPIIASTAFSVSFVIQPTNIQWVILPRFGSNVP